jgi:hypothetical protein
MGTDHEFVETNRRIEGGDDDSRHQQNPSSQVRIQTPDSHRGRRISSGIDISAEIQYLMI